MGNSTLDPDNLPGGADRSLGRGHGTGALGPSDTSDSGSDLQGALSADELDSDSDSSGTGERVGIGAEEMIDDAGDIDVDHVEAMPPGVDRRLDEAELADIDPVGKTPAPSR